MKKTSKIILMSVLTIVACVSLISGATFALFTSESSVNIAVTSGKVEVAASVQNFNAYTTDQATELNKSGGWLAGSSASQTDGEITLTNMTPGAGVEFDINLTNSSTVAIKYQVQLSYRETTEPSVDLKLMDALNVTVDGISLTKTGSSMVSEWTEVAVGEDIGGLSVTIYMPWNVDPQYSGLSGVITVAIHAVQGNANTDGLIYVENSEQFAEALDSLKEGETLHVADGEYALPNNISQNDVTIEGDGEGCVITGERTTVSGDNVTLRGLNFVEEGNNGCLSLTGSNVVLDGCTFEGHNTINLGNVVYVSKAEKVTVKNCTFNGGFRQIGWGVGSNSEIFIESCTFDGGTYAVHFDQMTNTTVTISDCTISGWSSFSSADDGKVIIKNTHFKHGVSGYNYLRPYVDTEMIDCTYDDNFEMSCGGDYRTFTVTNPHLPDGKQMWQTIDELDGLFNLVVTGSGADESYLSGVIAAAGKDETVKNFESLKAALEFINSQKFDRSDIVLDSNDANPTEYKATVGEVLRLTADNINLQGKQGDDGSNLVTINAGEFSCSGQAAMEISGNNCTLSNLNIKASTTSGEVSVLKISSLDNETSLVKDLTLRNLTLTNDGSVQGSGLNLHGVDGATVENITINNFAKVGISLAKATGVVIKDVTLTDADAANWADIGFMYAADKDNPSVPAQAYATPCDVTLDFASFHPVASSQHGDTHFNGLIYSERTDGALDILRDISGTSVAETAPSGGWIYSANGSGGWTLGIPQA